MDVDEILASHLADLAAGRTFGQAIVDHVREPNLPFLVRVAAGQAVRSIVAQWQQAGRPMDVETLKALFPPYEAGKS